MGGVVLDASVILALFDPHDALHAQAVAAVRRRRESQAQFVLAASVLAEVLVGAARRSNGELDVRGKQVIAAFGEPAPVDEELAVAAAALRGRHRSLRLPDALVLATADIVQADVVLAGDAKWRCIDRRVGLIVSTPPSNDPD